MNHSRPPPPPPLYQPKRSHFNKPLLLSRGFDTYSGLYVGDDTEETDDSEAKHRRQRSSSPRVKKQSAARAKRRVVAASAQPADAADDSDRREKRRQRKEAKRSRKSHRRKKKNPPVVGAEDRFESVLYASKAAEIIRGKGGEGRPFFIYLSFLTKSYPRDSKVKTRNHFVNDYNTKIWSSTVDV